MKRLIQFAAILVALSVVPSALSIDIADTTPPRGKVGEAYSWTLTTSPGSGSEPLTWVVPHSGVFPPGLVVSTSQNGRFLHITGTPTQAGVYRFYIQLRDAPQFSPCCTEEEFVIVVDAADPPPPPPPPPAGAFTVRVVAGDATTVTLGWDRQAGDGYVFYVNDRLVSRRRDPSRTTVRVSRGAVVKVCPGDLVSGLKPCGVYRP